MAHRDAGGGAAAPRRQTRTLRLTAAGRRYLRRHRAVTIGAYGTEETIDARVAG